MPTLTNGQILIGDGTTNSAAALSGDATLSAGTMTIANNAVTTAKINALAVDETKLAANAVTTGKILDATITGADIAPTTITADKLAQSAATNGQVLKWNGTNWTPQADNGSVVPTLTNGQILIGDGTTNTAAALSGDATLSGGTLTVSNNAITTAKINTGAVTSTKLATGAVSGGTGGVLTDGSITAADLGALGGTTNGQVLTYNTSSGWAAGSGGWTLTGNSGTSPASNYIGTSDAQPLTFKTGGNERMRIDATGRLGIGTAAPTSAVEVVGDVKIPAANNFAFASPKTKYLSVSNTAFQVKTDLSGNPVISGISTRVISNGGSNAFTVDTGGYGFAAVYLPDGATITAFQASIYVDPSFGGPMTVRLMRQAHAPSAPSTVATVTSSLTNTSSPSTTAITDAVIDNQNYSYQLVAAVASNFASLYSVRITYTISSVE